MSFRCQAPVNFIMRNSTIPVDLIALPKEDSSLDSPILRLSCSIKVLAIGVFSMGEMINHFFKMSSVIALHLVNLDVKEAFLTAVSDGKEVVRCALRVITCVPGFFIALVLPKPLFTRIEASLIQRTTPLDCQKDREYPLTYPQSFHPKAEPPLLGATVVCATPEEQARLLAERSRLIKRSYESFCEDDLGECFTNIDTICHRFEDAEDAGIITDQGDLTILAVLKGFKRFYEEYKTSSVDSPMISKQSVRDIETETNSIIRGLEERLGLWKDIIVSVLRKNRYDYREPRSFEET